MALQRKRISNRDTVSSAGIVWKHKQGTDVWEGEYIHNEYSSPIICKIDKAGNETYKWSYTTPGQDSLSEAGTTEGMAFWYAADDIRAAINKL